MKRKTHPDERTRKIGTEPNWISNDMQNADMLAPRIEAPLVIGDAAKTKWRVHRDERLPLLAGIWIQNADPAGEVLRHGGSLVLVMAKIQQRNDARFLAAGRGIIVAGGAERNREFAAMTGDSFDFLQKWSDIATERIIGPA